MRKLILAILLIPFLSFAGTEYKGGIGGSSGTADWNTMINIPAGFADGTDDSAGTPTAIDQGAGERDLRYDATAECYYIDENGDSVHDSVIQEQCIDGTVFSDSPMRMTCNPIAFMNNGSTTTSGIQECITYLNSIGGGTVILGPTTYNITGGVPLTIDSTEIVLQGAGMNATFLACTTGNGCTANSVIEFVGDVGYSQARDLAIIADRGTCGDTTVVDGIRIGEPILAQVATQCTAAGVPSECCTGAGAGAGCSGDYPNSIKIVNVALDGDSDDDVNTCQNFAAESVAVRNIGSLGATLQNVKARWFKYGYKGHGQLTRGITTVDIIDSSFRQGTSGIYLDGPNGGGVVSVYGTIMESMTQYGIHELSTDGGGAFPPGVLVSMNNHYEAVDTGIAVFGKSGGTARDVDVSSFGDQFATTIDGNAASCTSAGNTAAGVSKCCTGAGTGSVECDSGTVTDAVALDANSDSEVTSIGMYSNVGGQDCITHSGVGSVNFIANHSFNADLCVPTVGSNVVLKDQDNNAQFQKDATDCTDNNGNYGDFCQELDGNTLYVCETNPKCAGAGWTSYGGLETFVDASPYTGTQLGYLTSDTVSPIDCTGAAAPDNNCSGGNDLIFELVTGGVTATHFGANSVRSSEFDSTDAALESEIESVLEARAIDQDADGNQEEVWNISAGTGNCPSGGSSCACFNVDDDATTTDDICFNDTGFKANASASPTNSFDDTVDSDTTPESQIVCDANAADNGKCEIQVEDADGVYQAGLQVQSSGGTVSTRVGLSGGPSLTCTESGSCVFVGESTIAALGLEATAGDVHANCSAFPNPGGGIFFDQSEAKWKKCQNGTLTDLDTQSSGGVSTIEENNASVVTSSVTIDYLGADFDVTDAGAGEADVSIAAAISRDADTETLSNKTIASPIISGTASGNNTIPTTMLTTEVRSMHWGAGSMSADGTDCASPAEVSVASGPKFYSIACAMASSETDGFIYGNTVLPDSINIAADVTMELTARVVTDNAGATAHGYIEIQCVPADGTIGTTWSSGVDLDITQAAGDVADDLLQDTSAAVDLAQGANPDCVGGDTLFWRWKLCDTDATPSTGCTSSAGAENDHQIVAMKMEYTTDIGD